MKTITKREEHLWFVGTIYTCPGCLSEIELELSDLWRNLQMNPSGVTVWCVNCGFRTNVNKKKKVAVRSTKTKKPVNEPRAL